MVDRREKITSVCSDCSLGHAEVRSEHCVSFHQSELKEICAAAMLMTEISAYIQIDRWIT